MPAGEMSIRTAPNGAETSSACTLLSNRAGPVIRNAKLRSRHRVGLVNVITGILVFIGPDIVLAFTRLDVRLTAVSHQPPVLIFGRLYKLQAEVHQVELAFVMQCSDACLNT